MLELEGHERRTWRGKRGTLDFLKIPPSVSLVVFDGRVTDDAISAWHEHFLWTIGERDTLVFFDAGELSYASARVTANGISLIAGARKRMAAMHILISGSLIEAMADAANVTFGGFMQIHRERAVFEDELRRALGAGC